MESFDFCTAAASSLCSLPTLPPLIDSSCSPHSMNAPPPSSHCEESSHCLEGKMKRSPIFPRDENGGCNEHGYDPQEDFSKFLEEARKHSNEVRFEPELPSSFSLKKKVEAEGRKSKRSWKNSVLFFWWRFEKKCPSVQKTTRGAEISRLRVQSAVSGPISGGRSKQHIFRNGRPASGPLSGCFTPTRVDDEEAEIPYMCLDQLNTPSRNQTFGPIYLVT